MHGCFSQTNTKGKDLCKIQNFTPGIHSGQFLAFCQASGGSSGVREVGRDGGGVGAGLFGLCHTRAPVNSIVTTVPLK